MFPYFCFSFSSAASRRRCKNKAFVFLFCLELLSEMAGYWVFWDLVGLVQHIFCSFLVFVDQVLSLYSTMCLFTLRNLPSNLDWSARR